MNTFVWCEDTGSGFVFWKKMFGTLYRDFIVESKRNNSELCKAVSSLENNNGDKYYVMMDNAVDNPDVLREMRRLYHLVKDKSNVSIIRVHSFEFVLLSFSMLEDWVFAEEDILKEQRKKLLGFKKAFVRIICDGGDIQTLSVIKDALDNSYNKNAEQIAAKLLYEITRNTGFETTKGKLGTCFVIDCCDWGDRQSDDICGLDQKRLTGDEKIKMIFENSVLKESFAEAGL